jgi:sugar lactone lactonase YvrE
MRAEVAETEILLTGLSFPESPRWRADRLWFSDLYTNRVMTVDLGGRAETIAEVPNRPSGLGWTPAGEPLIVSMLDRLLLRLDGASLVTVADLSSIAGGPCNDMVVDAAGRAFIGNKGFNRHNGESPRNACLARVDPDGSVTRVAEDLMSPNGAVITPDGMTLIIAETRGCRLSAFDIDAHGALSNRRVFAQLDTVHPDGICLDAEGAVWVANTASPDFVRVFEGGRIDRILSFGERKVYACMLGGRDRRSLFVLTNTGTGPQMATRRDGRIEIIRVDAPGTGLP